MTNRHEEPPYEAGPHAPRLTPETLFSGTTYLNMLVSLSAFVLSLALFVSAHGQFRMLGARDATNLGGNGRVDNGPVEGNGLRYGPCLWMQATSLMVVLLTPVIRTASRVWGENKLQSAVLGRQSMWKV